MVLPAAAWSLRLRIDTRCFAARDVAAIALQRTTALARLPLVGSLSYRAWARNVPIVLTVEAVVRRSAILKIALAEIETEYQVIKRAVGVRAIDRMMDIGCGHGLIDVYFYNDFNSRLHLVDIETNDEKRHDFAATGAGYASLAQARRFLVSNGVPDDFVVTTNPNVSAAVDENLDLIISLLSCGFHYPVAQYAQFARRALKPGGLFIFDLRKNSGQEDFFDLFPDYQVLEEREKSQRIAAVAPP